MGTEGEGRGRTADAHCRNTVMLNVATTQSNQNVSSTPLHQRTSSASKPTMTIANGTLMDTKNALYALSKVPGNKQSHDTMDATATALLDWTRNRFSSDRSHCGNVTSQQPHRGSGAGTEPDGQTVAPPAPRTMIRKPARMLLYWRNVMNTW